MGTVNMVYSLGMGTVTISKTKYETLKRRAEAYERIVSAAREDMFSPPPTRNISEIMRDFRATKKYSTAFLKSLKKGLLRSSYFKTR